MASTQRRRSFQALKSPALERSFFNVYQLAIAPFFCAQEPHRLQRGGSGLSPPASAAVRRRAYSERSSLESAKLPLFGADGLPSLVARNFTIPQTDKPTAQVSAEWKRASGGGLGLTNCEGRGALLLEIKVFTPVVLRREELNVDVRSLGCTDARARFSEKLCLFFSRRFGPARPCQAAPCAGKSPSLTSVVTARCSKSQSSSSDESPRSSGSAVCE